MHTKGEFSESLKTCYLTDMFHLNSLKLTQELWSQMSFKLRAMDANKINSAE